MYKCQCIIKSSKWVWPIYVVTVISHPHSYGNILGNSASWPADSEQIFQHFRCKFSTKVHSSHWHVLTLLKGIFVHLFIGQIGCGNHWYILSMRSPSLCLYIYREHMFPVECDVCVWTCLLLHCQTRLLLTCRTWGAGSGPSSPWRMDTHHVLRLAGY